MSDEAIRPVPRTYFPPSPPKSGGVKAGAGGGKAGLRRSYIHAEQRPLVGQ